MRNILLTIFGPIVFSVLAGATTFQQDKMVQINVDIGENIFNTAKKSGAPKYTTGNIAGLVSYKILNMPPDIPVRFQRKGYEISALPLFALTLYADEENANDLEVSRIDLQFSKDAAKSHSSGQAFAENLIAQFQRGRWKRYIRDACPAVTGRSAFLDEAGEAKQIGGCPLDPSYHLTEEEWIRMIGMTQNYKWIGDGILATLTVRYSDDIRGITYSIGLTFDDLAIITHRDSINLARKLTEGDKNGWNSTAEYKVGLEERKARVKILEENAKSRGDSIVPR